MKIIDVSSWKEKENIITTGSREKFWVINPSDKKLFLFKIPKINGEIYAEILAAYLAINVYGLNVPETYLAKRGEKLGVLTKNFVSTGRNERFEEIIDYFGADFDANNLAEYTVEKAITIANEQNILHEFYEMCLFDSIIGNQDRHFENWGILYNSANQGMLAPLYDNGSSLLNGISEETIHKMLANEVMIDAYVNRARTCFTVNDKKRAKVKDFLLVLYKANPGVYNRVLLKFYPPNSQTIYDAINQISDTMISEERKKVLEKIINRKTLVLGEYK